MSASLNPTHTQIRQAFDRIGSYKGVGRDFGISDRAVKKIVERGQRLSPVLIVPDVHAPFHDTAAWRLMLDVARDFKPETVMVMGDLLDCYSISTHSKDPRRKAHLKDEIETCRQLRQDLDDLGAERYVFCEGNHEDRLRRYLWDRAPELFGLIDIPGLLQLGDKWEFIPYRDHTKRGAVHYTHDVGHTGRYATHQTLDTYQHSAVSAHAHRLCYVVEGNAVGEAKVSAQFGWLGDVEQVDYMHKAKAKKNWALGFGIGYEDKQTGHTFLVPMPIVQGRTVFNGKLFSYSKIRKRAA